MSGDHWAAQIDPDFLGPRQLVPAQASPTYASSSRLAWLTPFLTPDFAVTSGSGGQNRRAGG
jgi:hypothetical protein